MGLRTYEKKTKVDEKKMGKKDFDAISPENINKISDPATKDAIKSIVALLKKL